MPGRGLPLDAIFEAVESQACDDERSLVDRAKTQPEAFGRLYEMHYGTILNYIYRRTLDATLAEELTSNTFFNALRAMPRYDHRGKFVAWLYRIASNEIKLQRRSRHKEQQGNARWREELERVSFDPQAEAGGEIREIKMRHFLAIAGSNLPAARTVSNRAGAALFRVALSRRDCRRARKEAGNRQVALAPRSGTIAKIACTRRAACFPSTGNSRSSHEGAIAMKPAEPIERLLEQTPVPSLSEGPHGDRLRNQLLEHSTTIYLRKTKMSLSNRIPPALRTALAALVAILLIGSGWAAEKIYEQMTIRVEVSKPKEITLPDGTKAYSTVASVVDVDPNDPKSVEKADRTLKESLAAEEKRQDAMQKAIAAGRFRLIDVESNITHEYRDAGSDKTLQIMRLPNKDVGQIIGVVPSTIPARRTQAGAAARRPKARTGRRPSCSTWWPLAPARRSPRQPVERRTAP